ncbi:MAG: FAD-binding oxidoreductase [Sandaracinaceae bacterium]|nr:FAD-binding oxidoreductase [Sandaracinaceae bacterium]MBK8589267.1 FAD-binding oxidoreductase [Sandaracinaceae bacterium]MBP7684114.1 FAD-binding oxidoreductase [Deltaproteobacteria bacterium]
MIPAPPGTDSIRNDLARLVAGGKASSSDPDRVAYARDLWPRHQIATRAGNPAVAPPAVIVWPSNTEELSSVIAYAAARSIPVVPYGAGSGVCGGVLPTTDTVLIDMKMMRSLKTIDRARLTCDADAGMIGQHLEDDLGAAGFTLGHFPSSIYCSTLGGWVAGRSAGQCSGRYGKIEDMVLGLTVVDGTGRVLRAERGGDNSALLPLFIGSEGILGVVTEARLRIAPAPPCRRFASYLFPSTETGLDAIRRIYQAGLRPAVARLYDPFDSMIARRGGLRTEHEAEPKPKRTEAKPGLGLRALVQALRAPGMLNELIDRVPDKTMGGAKLILVWEADPLIADAELREARAICSRYDAQDTGEGPAKHWLGHRHSVSYRQSPLFTAGAFIDTMEVAATWSRLLPMYHAVRSALSPHVFVMAHFSHAYPDGASIYFTFAGAARDDHACELAYDRAWKAALKAVVAAGGTLSHHHGVGRSKAPAMRSEQGNAIDVVRELKRVMDPKGIFNRGALIPDLDEHTPLGPVVEAE